MGLFSVFSPSSCTTALQQSNHVDTHFPVGRGEELENRKRLSCLKLIRLDWWILKFNLIVSHGRELFFFFSLTQLMNSSIKYGRETKETLYATFSWATIGRVCKDSQLCRFFYLWLLYPVSLFLLSFLIFFFSVNEMWQSMKCCIVSCQSTCKTCS